MLPLTPTSLLINIRSALGIHMIDAIEYRHGVQKRVWQRFWHFNERCDGYPAKTFVILKSKPSDDVICSNCLELSRGK